MYARTKAILLENNISVAHSTGINIGLAHVRNKQSWAETWQKNIANNEAHFLGRFGKFLPRSGNRWWEKFQFQLIVSIYTYILYILYITVDSERIGDLSATYELWPNQMCTGLLYVNWTMYVSSLWKMSSMRKFSRLSGGLSQSSHSRTSGNVLIDLEIVKYINNSELSK